jgi:DNA-binding response OmpR family regulator
VFGFWAPKWPTVSFDEIRKRARLLAIDDHDFPYESLFQRDGYNLDKWNDVERLTDIEDGKYDLLLLDMQGIGTHESAEQGFGILKHLRAKCPTLVIVAYSNADWGLKYQEFFMLADAVLPKSADYVEFKRQVDDLLASRFSLGFYVSKIAAEAGDSDVDQRKIENLARRAILKRNPQKLRSHLETMIPDASKVDRIISIANAAIGLLQLWSR